MRVQSACYTNVIGLLHKYEWILILCLMIQCLIISENKVHGIVITTTVPSQHITPQNNTGNGNATTETQQLSNNTLSSTVQTVQPVRKIISTGAFIRAFYVFVGLGAIIVMYIVVRTVRLRRKKTAVRKYGVLASRDDLELTPLEREDEDEDTALFDMTAVKSRP